MTNGLYPPDYTSEIGVVRILIPDTAQDDLDEYLFSDAQIEALLSLHSSNVLRTAAQAKDILATDNVLLLKVLRTDDLSVNGAQVAAELRLQAKQLRDQANDEDALGSNDSFQIVYPQGEAYPEGVMLPYGRIVSEIARVPWPEI